MDTESKPKRSNEWIDFLKKTAAEKGLSYSQILSDPDSKVIYNLQKQQAAKKEAKPKQAKAVKPAVKQVKEPKELKSKPAKQNKPKAVKPQEPPEVLKSKKS